MAVIENPSQFLGKFGHSVIHVAGCIVTLLFLKWMSNCLAISYMYAARCIIFDGVSFLALVGQVNYAEHKEK